MKKFSQRIGEGVRIYKKTEEDEDFVQQERLVDTTRDATDKLVKCLAPKAGPKNKAKKLVKTGEKMQEVDKYNSAFGKGVACIGDSMKNLGHEHAELENRVQINTINPLKSYRDGELKEVMNLKKRYESNRLEYDTARRAYQSKNTPENEDKMNRVKSRYEEARDAYYEKLQHSQDDDHKHVEHLQAYTRAMIEYHRKCMEVFQKADQELASLSGTPSGRPASRKNQSETMTHVTAGPTASMHQWPPSAMTGQQPMQQQHGLQPPPYQQQPMQQHPQQYAHMQQPMQQQQQYGMAPPAMPARSLQPQDSAMRSMPGPMVGTGHHQQPSPAHQAPLSSPRDSGGAQPVLPMRQRKGSGGPKPIERCRALYDYDPVEVPNGMSIKAGDMITVLNKTPSGWWEGELRGQTGFFPSNYVQPM